MSYLHEMLSTGFDQSLETFEAHAFTLGAVTTTGFFAPADERTSMELTGYLDMIDLTVTAKRSAFATEPALNTNLSYGGATYKLRFTKTDESAIVLGFKKIST